MTNNYCVFTVLRYSWRRTVDLSEAYRVLYQINLRICESRFSFIIRIYHDARSSECQILMKGKTRSRRSDRKMAVRGIQAQSELELRPLPNTVRKCPPRATTYNSGSVNGMSIKMLWRYGNFQNCLLNF
jgi:hypothetical protein